MAAPNLTLFNQIAVAVGGEGGHEFNIDALNEIASQMIGSPQSFQYNLDALNAIAENVSGEAQEFTLIIDALNFISGELSGDGDSDTTSVGALTEWVNTAGGIGIITDRNQFANSVHTQTSGNKSATYRVRHVLNGDGRDVRLTYVNKYALLGSEANPGGSITIKARLVYNGVNIPVTFGGATSLVLAAGATGESDWMTVTLATATAAFLYVDTFVDAGVTVPDTTKMWPITTRLYGQLSEGRTLDADLTGLADAAPATVGTTASIDGYGPMLIQSRTPVRKKIVAIIGDSIATGQGDISGISGIRLHSNNDYGFIRRALEPLGIPYVRVSKPGETAAQYGFAGVATVREAMLLAAGATDAICQHGINDLPGSTTLANMKSRAQAIWTIQRNAGRRVYATTLTPRTLSSDYWVTTANQSHTSSTQTGAVSVRTDYNDWIRAGADGLIDGYFEVADAVESARNSGLWAERTILATGTVSTANSSSITVAGTPWVANAWRNCVVEITGGTGFPQSSSGLPRTIQDSTASTLTLIAGQAFSPSLDATTTFRIWKPLTLDGVHPSTEAATLMAAAIDTGVFL